MKKKIIALMLTSLILIGCGKKEEQKKENAQTTQKVEEKKDENKQEETKKEEVKLDINDPKSEEPDKDFVKNETGDVETKRIFRKNINEVLEHNGFKFTFKKVAILRYKPLTDRIIQDFKKIDEMNLIKNKEYVCIGLTVDIENNNDKIYNLSNYDTYMTTNLKEQTKTLNMFNMNDNTFLANTKKTLSYTFVFPNTDVEDIDKITELTLLTPHRYDEHGTGYAEDNGTTFKINIK